MNKQRPNPILHSPFPRLRRPFSLQPSPILSPLGFIILITLLASSCVSNKQITYLQYEDDLTDMSKVVTDSIIRVYESGQLQYTLQPNDIVQIRIATVTPEEYNPFAQADPMMSSSGTNMNRMMLNNNNQGSGNSMAQQYGYRIDPWGDLNLPVIGKLRAEGMTLDSLEKTINIMALEHLEDPVAKVNLMNFKYLVMGEVAGGGEMISSESNLTMMQAIASAGGPAEFGDISKVKVIRRIDDESFVFYVNLLDEHFISSEFYYVFPNDLIIVPPLKSRLYFNYITPNISIITSLISLTTSLLAIFAIRSATGG